MTVNDTRPRARRWLILAIVYVSQLAFAIIMQSVPPVLNLIIKDLGISHAQAGLLMGIFALPGIFISIPIGSLSDKYSAKYLCLISLSLMTLGTAFSALSSSFFSITLGRFVTGLGAISMLVVLPQFLSRWFLGKEIGIAMGVYNTGVPVGSLLSFNVVPILANTFTWRVAFWLGAAASFIALILFLIFYSAPPVKAVPLKPISEKETSTINNLFRLGRPVWLVAMCWMWFNAGFVAFTTFASDFFIGHNNLTSDQAGKLTSFAMWGPFILSTFIGFLIHKYSRQKLLIIFGNIVAGVAIINIYFAQEGLTLLMLMAGIGAAFIPSSIYSFPAALVDEKRLGLAFGIISMMVNISILGAPFFTGWVRDFTGSYLASFILIVTFLAFSTITILPLKKTAHRSP